MAPKTGKVREHVNIRLDPVLMLKLQSWIDKTTDGTLGISGSIRLLLHTALSADHKNDLTKAAISEGIRQGRAIVKQAFETAMSSTMDGFDAG
jgi:hypothetical protein